MSVDICADEPFGDGVPTLTKTYSDKDEYLKMSSNVRKYMDVIRKFGTSICAIDDNTKSIVIEYIPGKKLGNVLRHNLDPWKRGGCGFTKLFEIIKQIKVLLQDFHSYGVSHKKIDIDNFVIMDSVVKMTNLDTIVPVYVDINDIFSIIYDQIIIILDENIRHRQVLSNTIFEEQRESVNDLRRLMKYII